MYSAEINDACSRLAPVFIRDYLQRSPQSKYMFDVKKLLLIDALNFFPGEARDLLRIVPRIMIDLPEGRYLFKDFVKVKRWTDRPLAV